MSSPVSSLKKNRRSPLHSPSKPVSGGDRLAPFRHPDFSDDQIQFLTETKPHVRIIKGIKPFRKTDINEVNLIDALGVKKDESNRSLESQYRQEGLSSNEHELMSLLMSRLVQVESKLVEAQTALSEKDEKISSLEEKLRIYEHSQGSNVTQLEQKCLKYQQQVQDMERFLNDYGMVWIGGEKNSASDSDDSDLTEGRIKVEPVWKPGSSVIGNLGSHFIVNYDLIVENIKELNVIAGEGIARVDVSSGGARLKTTEPIPLTLFANGIMVFNGPFRSFSDLSTQQYVQDLMDGFYPSEIQLLYPEGVPFQLSDKRAVVFKPLQKPFEGEGYSMSGKRRVPVPSEIQISDYKFHFPDVEELKNVHLKIPKIVIRDGNIIDMYNASSKKRESKAQMLVVKTHELSENNVKAISLRIRSETSNSCYLLKLLTSDTIADVRTYLDAFRGSPATPYQIFSLRPFRTYDDDSAALLDCGFNHNVMLHLRPK